MCHADVTPIPFHWSPRSNPEPDEVDVNKGNAAGSDGEGDDWSEITPMLTIPHTCHDFDAIRAWARAHPVARVACADPATRSRRTGRADDK